ncbi:MAG: hypothetical protein WC631_02685 [Candidatus Paceibacterota bacterium]|jgi:hypothetical protein
MKKILVVITISLILSGYAMISNASTISSNETSRENIKKAIDDAVNKMKAVQEKRNNLEQRVEKIIETAQDKFIRNFDVAIINLNRLSAKTSAVITRISDSGKDIEVEKSLLASSTVTIAKAKTEYDTLKNLVSQTATITRKEKRVVLDSVKIQSEKTKEAIKAAHASIVNVIKSLKMNLANERDGAEQNESTSNSTSTNNQ